MPARCRVVFAGLAALALLLANCGAEQPIQAAQDLLFLSSARGVTIVKPKAEWPTFKSANAIPSPNWSTVVRSFRNGPKTRVAAFDPSSGAERWSTEILGNFTAKVVSENGEYVALGPVGERYHITGRRYTKLVVVRKGVTDEQSIILDGNFEPEAFSTDGHSLFLIKYMPETAPTHYQVRRLDLDTEHVRGVYTVDEDLQEAMKGTARIQAGSPDGRRLYTLYTVGGSREGTRRAFVHVLSLDEEWAHCIDLPDEFGNVVESAAALTVSEDGSRLYVTNAINGTVAEVDTEKLSVIRTSTTTLSPRVTPHAVVDRTSNVYIASDRRVTALDASSLDERRSWTMPDRVSGLQMSGDGSKLYVGLRSRVATLDVATGKVVRMADPPGVKRIRVLGPVIRSPARTDLVKCAC